MNMMTKPFDEICVEFEWVFSELNRGMSFIQGCIPSVGTDDLRPPIMDVIERSKEHDFKYSTWSNETNESDWKRSYDDNQYIDMYYNDRIVGLHLDYLMTTSHGDMALKLLIDKNGSSNSIEIIIYREFLLADDNLKDRLKMALDELLYISDIFSGDSLFIGPDGCDVPKNANDCPENWIKVK